MASPIDRDALERALTLVAEESFFTMVDPASDAPLKEGSCIAACVDFSGPFTGKLCCRMTRTLAHELTSAFTGAKPEDVAADGPEVADLAGEFANMTNVLMTACSGTPSSRAETAVPPRSSYV